MSDYHSPSSPEELVGENIRAVAEMERAARATSSLGDKIAVVITRFAGSMLCVWVHAVWFAAWIAWNTWLPVGHFDPFPYTFLTLIVSLEAIFLSTFILVASNRNDLINERRSHLDLQINLLAEQESTKALKLLRAIAQKLEIPTDDDPSVELLEQAVEPERLASQIDEFTAIRKEDDPIG